MKETHQLLAHADYVNLIQHRNLVIIKKNTEALLDGRKRLV
jgi:hypothetical protein